MWTLKMHDLNPGRKHVSVDKFEYGLYDMCIYFQPTAHNVIQYRKDRVRLGTPDTKYSKVFQKLLHVVVKRCGWMDCTNTIAKGNVCGGCMRIRYCSTKCQRAARPYHRLVCSLGGPLAQTKQDLAHLFK